MKKTKIKHRLSIVIRVLFSVSLMVLVLGVGNTVLGDELKTAEGKNSATTTLNDTYEDVVSATVNLGTSTSYVNKVLVISTYMVEALTNNDRTATFRLADATNSVYTNGIIRSLERDKGGDKGIGSLVYIFDVSGNSGDVTFKLQHKTSNNSYNNTTSGTIVAVALSPTNSSGENPNGNHLNADVQTLVGPLNAGQGTYTTALTTASLNLPVSGSFFIAASVNNQASTSGTNVGTWQLQQQKDGGTWLDIGIPITRSISSNSDEGIASLGLMVTGLTSGDYSFQLQHKCETGQTIQTINTNLVAIALAYDDATNGGHTFPAFNNENTGGINNVYDYFNNVEEQEGTPSNNTDMLFYAQYNMTADDALNAPSFDMHVTDGASFNYSSETQQRRLSGASDIGAGGSVGLSTGLSSGISYTASLRQKSDGTVSLTTYNVILCGFQTDDYAVGGYWMGGTVDHLTDWNTGGNWANGSVPTSETNVSLYDKTYDPVISASANCKNLNIESGSVTIDPDGALTVAEEIINDVGNSGLVIQSTSSGTGSLIISGTATGDITVERYLTQGKWHYISEPVNDTRVFNTFLSLTGGADHDQFYWWDENGTYDGSTGIWFDILNNPTGISYTVDNFVSSQGYAINYEGTGNETISFSGVPYTENKSIIITKDATSTNEGANLIGNPFTSTIAINTNADGTNNFLTHNAAAIDDGYESVYLWNESEEWNGSSDEDYLTISNATGATFAAPGQAFMVVAASNDATINFNKTIQKHGSATFYKNTAQDETPRFYMSVQNDEGLYNEILIAFIDGMTKGLDPSYDAGKLKGNPNIALYTKLVEDNGADFAHQALPPLDNKVVAVKTGLDVSGAGSYTFKIKELQNFDGAITIKLEDKVTGSLIDFRQAEEYSFFINTPGEIRERFVLHFNGVTGIEDEENITKPTIQTYASNNTLYILNPKMKRGTITIINLTGQKVATFKLTGDTKQQQTLNVSNLINIVQIKTDNEVISKKVIFKY